MVRKGFFLSLAFTLIAACIPLPKNQNNVSVPWKLLFMVAAVGTTAHTRLQVNDARDYEREILLEKNAALKAKEETLDVVAKVQAEYEAEQAVVEQIGGDYIQTLPAAVEQVPNQAIAPTANPQVPTNTPQNAVEPPVAPQPLQAPTMPVETSQPTNQSDQTIVNVPTNSSSKPITAQTTPISSDNKPDVSCKLFDRIRNHKKKHLIIPAETGSGKTSMLLGIVDYFLTVEPNTEFYFSTAKPGPFLGFEDKKADDGNSHVIELNMAKPDSIAPLITRLDWLTKKMVERQQQRKVAEQTGAVYNPSRVVIVLDEWLASLSLAEQHYKSEIRIWQSFSPKERGMRPYDTGEELLRLVNNIAIMGREDNFCIWLYGQDHQVQNAGINTGLIKNFGVLVPFSMDCMDTLENAVIGNKPIPPSTTGKELYADAMSRLKADPSLRLVYSNLYGHELLECPYLPNIKRKRIFEKIKELPKPQQVLKKRLEGVPFEKAICDVYECAIGSHEFNVAKLNVIKLVS